MKIAFLNLPQDFVNGTKEILPFLGLDEGKDGIPVSYSRGEGLSVKCENGKVTIICEKKSYFFRALGLLSEHSDEKDFCVTENTVIKTVGVMIDASRSAVMTVEAIKELLRYLSVMGYGVLMMYTEDTYEVKEYPYFGYMRGRYTYDEMKQCDDYADWFGIEMLPCIQVLSHLEQYLRWSTAKEISDTNSILLVGEEKTYEFIEALIKSATAPFRSRRIHLGMDEAWMLGRGKYMDRFGVKPQFEIFMDHLDRISKITDRLGIFPMMWTSTFEHVCTKNHVFDRKIAAEVKKRIPKNYTLLPGSYGTDDCMQDVQNIMSFDTPCAMIGGLWNWQGHYPEWNMAFESTRMTTAVCKELCISEYLMTSWGNDGHECDPFAILPGLCYTAELCFGAPIDMTAMRTRFSTCTHGDFDAFFAMANFQNRFEQEDEYKNYHRRFMGKKLLWQDPLEGLADSQLFERPLSEHYAKYAAHFAGVVENDNSRWHDLYRQAAAVFDVLAKKTYLAERLVPAYKANDSGFLTDAADRLFPELEAAFRKLAEVDRMVWMSDRKVFGWSLQDIRYGGMCARITTASMRLRDYLSGRVNTLPELDEPRLDMNYNGFGAYRHYGHAFVL